MDNKQIVDDVQIRECGHYWSGTCHAYVDNTGKFLLCASCPNCYYKQLKCKEQELEPFKDDYFKNLDTKTIAELAKKSIRLTTENRKFEEVLYEIEINISEYQALTLGKPRTTRENDCIRNILDIINKARKK